MNGETRSDYEIRCPKWKELMHTVMVNGVKGWKIFNISQSDPGSSRDSSCCARIDIVWTSCPRKLCQVKHQITVTNHSSQSDLGSSQDLSCCDRIDIEWPRALMQMGQVRFNKSHAIYSTSIVCKFVGQVWQTCNLHHYSNAFCTITLMLAITIMLTITVTLIEKPAITFPQQNELPIGICVCQENKKQ
jgi:hypothetical protein